MMRIPMYQIDAFTSEVFHGNPAAVCLLEAWLPDPVLHGIAAENNLSETAFLVPAGEEDEADYQLRWFTPEVEVALCGHATLASAYVVFTHRNPRAEALRFSSRSGILTVVRKGGRLEMDFPAYSAASVEAPPGLFEALGTRPVPVLRASDDPAIGGRLVAVYASEEEVRALEPDFSALLRVGPSSVVATAPGNEVDFVSRFFAPAVGIDEDPVTGSSHCVLVPWWAGRLGKLELHARQVSARGGDLYCEARGSRVRIAGEAIEFLSGTVQVP